MPFEVGMSFLNKHLIKSILISLNYSEYVNTNYIRIKTEEGLVCH